MRLLSPLARSISTRFRTIAGRADKEVLCFQHLQFHHNLSSRAAKKIVLALVAYTPKVTRLFHNNDLITQSKCAVRKLKSKCPLLSRHIYGTFVSIPCACIVFVPGLHEQHRVPNIPCDRADQDIFLFHHLTYFHKLNAKAATRLIRALLINKDPLEPVFHSNEIIVASDQTRTNQPGKTKSKSKKNYTDSTLEFSTHVSDRASRTTSITCVIRSSVSNVSQRSPNRQSSTVHEHELRYDALSLLTPLDRYHLVTELETSTMPLDCSKWKQQACQVGSPLWLITREYDSVDTLVMHHC